MNLTTPTNLRRIAGCLGLAVWTGLAASCATSPQPTQTKATTPSVRTSVSTEETDEPAPEPSVDEPTPEELAKSPCGNPEWAQLPPDSEVDGDREDETDSAESSETTSDTEDDESPSDSSDDSQNTPER